MQRFRGLTVSSWQVDHATLRNMGLADVVLTPRTELVKRMIQQGRADFTILEFGSSDDERWNDLLVMVPGIKVGLNATRHFPVSPKRPDLLDAVNAYIRQVREAGPEFMNDVWRRSGFIAPEYADWEKIYP